MVLKVPCSVHSRKETILLEKTIPPGCSFPKKKYQLSRVS